MGHLAIRLRRSSLPSERPFPSSFSTFDSIDLAGWQRAGPSGQAVLEPRKRAHGGLCGVARRESRPLSGCNFILLNSRYNFEKGNQVVTFAAKRLL